MKTIRYDRFVFFDKKNVCSAHKLARIYGVECDSYAGDVLHRIHHFFFGDATDLRKEYRRFYKNEFDDVDQFLECHLNIPENVRRRLIGHSISYVNLDEKGEDLSDSFSYDDELKSQFWNLMGGIDDENPSGIRYEQFFD